MESVNFGKTGIFIMNVQVMTHLEEQEKERATLSAQRRIQNHILELLKSTAEITVQMHITKWKPIDHIPDSIHRRIYLLTYFNNPGDTRIDDLCNIRTTPTNPPRPAIVPGIVQQYFDPVQLRWKDSTITLYRRTG